VFPKGCPFQWRLFTAFWALLLGVAAAAADARIVWMVAADASIAAMTTSAGYLCLCLESEGPPVEFRKNFLRTLL